MRSSEIGLSLTGKFTLLNYIISHRGELYKKRRGE